MEVNDEGQPAPPPQDVAGFFAVLSADQRAALEALRLIIRAAAPETTEQIAYGVPAFKYRGRPFVSYSATKRHCSLHVQSPAVMDAHGDELAAYDTTRGTIHFQPDSPLPEALVTKLVRARMAETDTSMK